MDWRVIRSSALAGLVIIIPAAVISSWLASGEGAWPFVFLLVVMFGFIVAGFGGGFLRSDTPMKHGALAAIACYAIVQLFGLIRRLIAGESVNPATYLIMLFIAATLGLIGGLFGDWHRRKNVRRSEPS